MDAGDKPGQERAERLAAEGAKIFHQGRYAEALDLFDAAIALDGDNLRALTGRALALAQMGQYREAFSIALDLTYRFPHYPRGYAALALCLLRMGRAAEAGETYRRALAICDDEPSVLYNYACYWAEVGDEEKCREALRRAFSVAEDHTLDHARQDPDLARYSSREWFKELLAEEKLRRAQSRKGR